MLTLLLPYPPSGNHAVKHARGGRHYLTRATVDYRREVWLQVRQSRPMAALSTPLRVELRITYPDRRRRDADNVAKTALDALTKAGVWTDDHLIYDLRLVREGVGAPGRVFVTIEEIYQREAA